MKSGKSSFWKDLNLRSLNPHKQKGCFGKFFFVFFDKEMFWKILLPQYNSVKFLINNARPNPKFKDSRKIRQSKQSKIFRFQQV